MINFLSDGGITGFRHLRKNNEGGTIHKTGHSSTLGKKKNNNTGLPLGKETHLGIILLFSSISTPWL